MQRLRQDLWPTLKPEGRPRSEHGGSSRPARHGALLRLRARAALCACAPARGSLCAGVEVLLRHVRRAGIAD